MTEEEAKAWLDRNFDVSRETWDALYNLCNLTRTASQKQNLIAASTVEHIWSRHVVDSAQLLLHAGSCNGVWIDLGSGAGFPGLVTALLAEFPVRLLEVRKKRAEHLLEMIKQLGLSGRVSVEVAKVETVKGNAAVISARAFAPLPRLFEAAHHFSGPETVWVLPKGKSGVSELEAACSSWQGVFRVEPSVTDSESAIIVARSVSPRRAG